MLNLSNQDNSTLAAVITEYLCDREANYFELEEGDFLHAGNNSAIPQEITTSSYNVHTVNALCILQILKILWFSCSCDTDMVVTELDSAEEGDQSRTLVSEAVLHHRQRREQRNTSSSSLSLRKGLSTGK